MLEVRTGRAVTVRGTAVRSRDDARPSGIAAAIGDLHEPFSIAAVSRRHLLDHAFKAVGAGMLVLATACATDTAKPHNEALVREFAAKGYAAVEHDSTTSASHTWIVSGQSVTIALVEPVVAGTVPVVIYLPALGEASESGARWRSAWASAGYAVLSVQLLDDDATAWKSDLARSGEFKTLARQRYAGAVMSRRVQLLADLVAEGRRRSAAGEAAWRRLDWSKLAIAGFDLGAYTALTVAGEHVRGAEDAAGRVAVRGAIIVSPHASLADGSLDSRFRDIHMPVLSVTSDTDGDVLGLVEGPYLREAPFTQMQGPDKYLLSLRSLSHAALGGAAEPNEQGADAGSAKRSHGAGPTDGDESGQRRRGSKRSAANGGVPVSRGADGSANGLASTRLSPDALEMRMIAARSVSTAFLDAYLKDDALAREWLTSHARQWLGSIADLRRK
jgi:hypothetical protein